MSPTLEQIVDLVDQLRQAGFNVGTEQYVAAQDLLIALAAHGALPRDARQWRTLLAPIFCATPAEQEEFSQQFEHWIGRHPQLTPESATAAGTAIEPAPEKLPRRSMRERLWPPQTLIAYLLPLLAAAGIGILVWGVWSVFFAGGSYLFWTIFLSLGLLVLVYGGWRARQWLLQQAMLRRFAVKGDPQLNRISLKGADEQLFHGQTFLRMIQSLRRHREVAASDLDIDATVQDTIRRGGLFTPVFRARKASPEYLYLIDRAGPGDEQARFGEEMARRLEASGVFVERFYFQNDPLTCWPRHLLSGPVRLSELASRHPDHQLIIFGDGAGFMSPISGEPQRWLELLRHWPRRTLLTPELSSGYREQALARLDLRILPATEDGLALLAGESQSEPEPVESARPFPPLIVDQPRRWIERHEPRPETANELLAQLQDYLDAGGWYWLRACAVFPVMMWEITLYLGVSLLGQSDEFESRLLSLVRLPWFRYGFMPDWLRLRLIETFTPEQEQAVRSVIEAMLKDICEEGEISLEVAESVPAETPGILAKLKSRIASWRRRENLAAIVNRQPEESPLRDVVLVSFLAGRKARRLSVGIPDLLRHVLLGRRKPILQWREWGKAVATYLGSRFSQNSTRIKESRVTTPPVESSRLPDETVTSAVEEEISGDQFHPSGRALSTERIELDKDLFLEMVNLSAGEFMMGGDRYDDEKPLHRVRVSPFAIGKYQVTQAQWKAVMGKENNPSRFKGEDLPVEMVSWNDVQEFIRRLNEKTKQQFRLPTEAEWEYAARAGTMTEYCFGDDEKQLGEYAWYDANSGSQTHPVGQKKPNKFGLYDMHGNVWEWCQDWYSDKYYQECHGQGVVVDPQGPGSGSYRVRRGGGWGVGAVDCRSADRGGVSPGVRGDVLGFRLVRIGR